MSAAVAQIVLNVRQRFIVTSNVRDQRRRAVGAPLADRNPWMPLAIPASGVTTSDDRCIA
jgi:hypothetical protein